MILDPIGMILDPVRLILDFNGMFREDTQSDDVRPNRGNLTSSG